MVYYFGHMFDETRMVINHWLNIEKHQNKRNNTSMCFPIRKKMSKPSPAKDVTWRTCGTPCVRSNWLANPILMWLPSLKLTARPWKLMVGRWVSFWDSLVSGRVTLSHPTRLTQILYSSGFHWTWTEFVFSMQEIQMGWYGVSKKFDPP